MTEGLHGWATSLDELEDDLRDVECVTDARLHREPVRYLEVVIDGDSIPPEVSERIGRSGFSIVGPIPRFGDEDQTVIGVREVGR